MGRRGGENQYRKNLENTELRGEAEEEKGSFI